MSDIRRLAGAVLCVGVPGNVASDALRAELLDLRPGAFILFARNVSTLAGTRAFVAALREAAGGDVAPLVCVDQEGGRVARLSFGRTAMPSMLALGATQDAKLAERAGARLAADLCAVGANVDFAPVVDLALEPASTVIGTRSLGDDAHRVARLGAALVRGLQARGVAAAPKHFPGHGATALDSHAVLPVLATSADVLRARELVPFGAAFQAGARAVMTAHVVVEAVDGALPATLSRRVLGDVLRGELGFEGVCFTDCLQMDAIARGIGTVRGAVRALAAGADSVVISHALALAHETREAIVAAVATGELPLGRLAEAAGRVTDLRRWAAANDAGPAAADGDVALEIARRAVAVVYGDPRLATGRPVTVVSFEGDASDGVAQAAAERPSLSLALRRRRYKSELLRVPRACDPAMREMLVDLLGMQSARNVVIVARRAHLYPEQARTIAALLAVVPHTIAVSVLEPFDVPELSRASAVICTFGDDEASVDALADVLTGRAVARGTLPVALPALRA